LQGRTVTIDLKKGDELSLRGIGTFSYESINFCVTLIHANNVETVEKLTEPKVELLPTSENIVEKIPTFTLDLKSTDQQSNSEYIQGISEAVENNKLNASECSDDFKRTCKGVCNTFRHSQCEPGCKFDLELLGECMKPPYGYFKAEDSSKGIINPCFFLKFRTKSFINISEEYANKVKCKAEIVFDRQRLYDLFFKLDRNDISPVTQEYLEYFKANEATFRKMASTIEESEMNLLLALKRLIEGLKVIKEMEKDPDTYDMFKEYLFSNGTKKINMGIVVGDNVEAIKTINMLSNDRKAELIEKVRVPYSQPGKAFGHYEIWRLLRYHDVFYNHSEKVSHLITDSMRNREIMSDPVVLHLIEDQIEKRGKKDEQEAFKKIMNFKDDFYKFAEIDRELRKVKDDARKSVLTKVFPHDGSIPPKYFPMNGSEESPIVAVKVFLEEHSWVNVGQQVNVMCEVFYDGFDGRSQKSNAPGGFKEWEGPGVVKFNLLLN